jgi:hypothetical protein
LALLEIQPVDAGLDFIGEDLDTLTQSALLGQFLPLGEQRISLFFQSAAPGFQLLTATQQLLALNEPGLVEVGDWSVFRGGGRE